MSKALECPECNSGLFRLKRRNYPMFTEDGKRTIEKTYECLMCNCEYLSNGTPVDVDKKQTLSSSGSHGYQKMY